MSGNKINLKRFDRDLMNRRVRTKEFHEYIYLGQVILKKVHGNEIKRHMTRERKAFKKNRDIWHESTCQNGFKYKVKNKCITWYAKCENWQNKLETNWNNF